MSGRAGEDGEPDPVLRTLLGSRKYRDVAPDALDAAIGWARARARSDKDVAKLAKRKLHQVFGAFIDDAARRDVLATLAEAADEPDDDRWTALLAHARGRHASTAEREPELGSMWDQLRRLVGLGADAAILDLGCGLGPLAAPMAGCGPGARYLGVDLDRALCDACRGALAARYPGVDVRAADVRSVGLDGDYDLALLLKLAPTLDQLERGATEALLARVPARAVALSFPSRTLGGRDVGMVDRFEATAAALLRGWNGLGVIALRSERVYVAARP